MVRRHSERNTVWLELSIMNPLTILLQLFKLCLLLYLGTILTNTLHTCCSTISIYSTIPWHTSVSIVYILPSAKGSKEFSPGIATFAAHACSRVARCGRKARLMILRSGTVTHLPMKNLHAARGYAPRCATIKLSATVVILITMRCRARVQQRARCLRLPLLPRRAHEKFAFLLVRARGA